MLDCRKLGSRCRPLMLPEGSFRLCPLGGSSSVGAANPAGPYGQVVAGGPVGPDGTLSPLSHDVILLIGPLEHSVLDHDGPAGQHVTFGPVGLFGTLSPSDCHPAGPYVAGGPVGPDKSLQVLDPLEHSVLDHADPAGRHVAIGPVGQFGTLSPSDCHPAGPAGPYVAGANMAQMRSLKFWIR